MDARERVPKASLRRRIQRDALVDGELDPVPALALQAGFVPPLDERHSDDCAGFCVDALLETKLQCGAQVFVFAYQEPYGVLPPRRAVGGVGLARNAREVAGMTRPGTPHLAAALELLPSECTRRLQQVKSRFVRVTVDGDERFVNKAGKNACRIRLYWAQRADVDRRAERKAAGENGKASQQRAFVAVE